MKANRSERKEELVEDGEEEVNTDERREEAKKRKEEGKVDEKEELSKVGRRTETIKRSWKEKEK